jgi:hypothetical protein
MKWIGMPAVLMLVLSGPVMAESLIKAEVQAQDGTEINVSVPLSLLEILKTSFKGPIAISDEEICPLVDSLISDLESLQGQDLVRIENKDNVRVWVAELDGEHPEQANFIEVNVEPAGEDQPDIQVRLPKGLILLASCIGNKVMELQGQEIFNMIPKPPVPPAPFEGAPSWEHEDDHHGDDNGDDEEEEMDEDDEDEDEDEETPDPEAMKREMIERMIEELQESLEE